MYRLHGPKLIIFIPIIIIGIIVVAATPLRFGTTRILALSSLVLAEIGLSFIPILALYPKATPFQAVLLAVIYFFTTFIICFTASGINGFGWPGEFAFAIKDSEFIINIYALFVANFFSFLSLILNFRLVYDEELLKSAAGKQKSGYKKEFGFIPFQKTIMKESFKSSPSTKSSIKKTESARKAKSEGKFEDDFLKPFEFEPEISTIQENLPQESSGKLFSPKKEENKKTAGSEFFDDDDKSVNEDVFDFSKEPVREKETSKETSPELVTKVQVSPFPPSPIKDDLNAIFEQYSSLNAIKKLTATKKVDIVQQKKKNQEILKPTSDLRATKNPEIKINVVEDIHEGSFRSITEEEKLQEIKEELKKELEEDLQAKLIKESQLKEEALQKSAETKEKIIQSIEEVKETFRKELEEKLQSKSNEEVQLRQEAIQKTAEAKDEIIQSIEKIKEELKREFDDKLQSRLSEEASKKEEAIQKTAETKDEIIQSIEEIKEELIENFKTELKKEIIGKVDNEDFTSLPEISTEEKSDLEQILIGLNNKIKANGGVFISYNGKLIIENWLKKQVLQKNDINKIAKLYSSINNEVKNTNQGDMLHLLLESEDGILAFADMENKILSLHTSGTGEFSSGQILRALSEIEE